MRIETIARQGALTDVQAEQKPALPQKGDVIRATVLSQEGESVSLKGEDGRVFSARLASETMLLPNDIAELMVSESTADRLILRLVFVEPAPQGAVAAETVRMEQTAILNADAAALLDAFASFNMKPSAQALATATHVMGEYGVDAKTAAFFAANDIEATNESIKAFQTLAEGKTIGKALYELSQSIANALGETAGQAAAKAVLPQPAVNGKEAVLPQSAVNVQEAVPRDIAAAKGTAQNTTQADGAKTTLPQAAANVPEAVSQDAAAVTGTVQNITQNATKNVDTTQNATKNVDTTQNAASKPQQGAAVPGGDTQILTGEGNTAVSEGSAQGEIANTAGDMQGKTADTAQTQAPATQIDVSAQADSAGPATATHNANRGQTSTVGNPSIQAEDTAVLAPKELQVAGGQAQDTQSLSEKILTIFTKVDEELNAQTLKTAAEQAPYKLAQLQKLIKNAEPSNKETISSQFSEVNAQAKLTQDISRFICMQIPIRQNGYDSAELYIYKRNRKGARIDAENTSVILGLSTQNMGRVEALIRVENRSISLTFGIENEAAIPAFRERSMELHKTLSGMRYSLAEFKVSALNEPTTPANAEELLTASMQKIGASIDYRV